jgi:DNA-binding transcriptional ArsR family regulator
LQKRGALPILSQMANQIAALTDVFYALADPTRRRVVSLLGRGPESVSTLAAPFAMALPSFMKHLAVLERSGLVRSSKIGRTRTCELQPKALTQAERWIAEQRALWQARSDRMAAFTETLHQEELSRDRTKKRRQR